jgi:heme exporter protein B
MSYLKQLWAIARKDLLIELRSRERIGAMAGFTLLTGVMFEFAVDWTAVRADQLASALVWLTVIFGGTLGLGRTFELEAQDEAFQGVLLTPVPRDAIFLGKVLSNYVIVLTVTALVMAVFGVLFALDWGGRPLVFAGTIALGGLGFVAIGTLFSAVSSGTAIGQTLLPLLLFPLLTPMVIYGTGATARLMVGRPWVEVEPNVRILGAFALIGLTGGAMLFRYVVED